MSQENQDLMFFTSPDEEFWKPHPYLSLEISNHGRARKGAFIYTPWENRDNYLSIRFARMAYRLHRLVGETWIDKVEDGFYNEIDHINGNRSDNRVQNLRWANRMINNRNKSNIRGTEKARLKHMVRVTFAGKRISYGTFQDQEVAKEVAKKVRSELLDVTLVTYDLLNEVVRIS